LIQLANWMDIDMPSVSEVDASLDGSKTDEVVAELLSRPLRSEQGDPA